MSSLEDMDSLNREELLALLAELQRQVAELTASNASLRSEIAELQRSTKRQAAPFSKGTRVSNPKRPGRQPGEGTFSFRQAPRPEAITEPPVNVPVTLECCLRCGRRVRGEHPDLAPDQYGATAHRLGPRAMATAHALHYQVGIPVLKTPL